MISTILATKKTTATTSKTIATVSATTATLNISYKALFNAIHRIVG